MHYHINHCFCTKAEHTNDFYDANCMVDIDRLDHDKDDWDNLIDIKRVVSIEELEIQTSVVKSMKEKYPDIQMNAEEMATRDCPVIKAEVRQWLNDNIKPQKDGEVGWCVGNDQYNLLQSYRMAIFFQRRNDAKKFIKTFSKYKKATSYFDYMKDPIVNLVLDIETGKYNDRH